MIFLSIDIAPVYLHAEKSWSRASRPDSQHRHRCSRRWKIHFGAASIRCDQVLYCVHVPLRRARPAAQADSNSRHGGHRDFATTQVNTAGFLDISAARIEFDGAGVDRRAGDAVFAVLDAWPPAVS
jgi:hypothetical protein